MTEFILSHKEAAIWADPGLGKTRSVIDALKEMLPDGAIRGALIVAPLRVALFTWPDEIEKWGGLTYANLRTEEGMKAWKDGTADVFLINYEMLATRTVSRMCRQCTAAKRAGCAACKEGVVTTVYHNTLAKCLRGKKPLPADMIVWDESSKTRKHDNKAVAEFNLYRHKFKRHVGLTGTPQPNSCLDLWGQFNALDGGKRLGPSYHAFRQRYATKSYDGHSWEVDPGSPELIQEKISDMTLVMRDEDWLNIPAVTVDDIDITLSPQIMRGYRKLQKEMLIEIEQKEVVALSAAALVQKLSQYASGMSYYMDDDTRDVVYIHDEKIRALAKLHKSIGYKPLLVFIQFRHEMDRILKTIPQARAFDGAKLSHWNAGKIPMWIVHPKSAAFGLQMQGTCCNICWFTLGYSYEDYKQGNARVARTGQQNPVTIYRLLCANTVDWAIAEVIRTKGYGESALKSALKFIKKLANFSEVA